MFHKATAKLLQVVTNRLTSIVGIVLVEGCNCNNQVIIVINLIGGKKAHVD